MKRKLMRVLRLGLVALLTFFLASCASAPTQEMADARSTIWAAEEIGAAPYATEQMNEAQAALSGAEVNLALGDYRKAKDWALLARDKASEALLIAQAIKQAEQEANIARSMGYLPVRVEILLGRARKLVNRNPDEAIMDAQQATKLADHAINQGDLEQAQILLRRCQAKRRFSSQNFNQAKSQIEEGHGSAALSTLKAICSDEKR
ncbi:MAG: DUF4398 domain-containing protein [Proteobacteria bacterium]|nr:DUF4398 domain-containing protein [Pseudomonadota bacterium]MDE3207500.1 DUF4398 domain-containing protein [Pseudomonadota bacterium]